jgi:hypothetical protein
MFATGVKGNGMTLGLTNGSQNVALALASTDSRTYDSNCFGKPIGSTSDTARSTADKSWGVTTDSTKSGIVLDTQNITIPDGWNLYYKVANAVTNLELLDVAKVTADLNTCYKKNASDNSDLSGLSTPSNKYIDLTLNASGSSYTAPANGYFILSKISNGTNQYITMGVGNLQITNYCPQSGRWFQMVTPLVQKGQSCYVAYDLGGTTNWFRFYYAQGEV